MNDEPVTLHSDKVQAPKSRAQILHEIATTGNPLAWLLMKMREPDYEFAPGYAYEGGDKDPILKEPMRYGLKEYRVKNLHLDTGENVTAWYKPAAHNMPTIAYCHGNAGSLQARATILQELSNRGFGVVIAAYPGFKRHRPGATVDPSEQACVATGHAMIRYLLNNRQVPMEKIVLFGESLGASVALQTARLIEKGIPEFDYKPETAPPVVCWAAFTSLVKRAKEQFPLLPADLLMTNRFESDKIIGSIKAPIMLMHGREDDYTSCRHSIELQKASGGKARLELIADCNHSCTFPGTERPDPDRIKKQVDVMQQFLCDLNMCPAPPLPRVRGQGDWQSGLAGAKPHHGTRSA